MFAFKRAMGPFWMTHDEFKSQLRMFDFKTGRQLPLGQYLQNVAVNDDGYSVEDKLIGAFRVKAEKRFLIGEVARVYSLPPIGEFRKHEEDLYVTVGAYGYMIIVEGPGFYGTEVYFVDRSVLALAAAIEPFQKLMVLS